ncbi:MAG: hypothetical protein IT432_07160 [Phycisphaerales bacterium]|nr:hypothetical protein [Phycisphaerales bacterium]
MGSSVSRSKWANVLGFASVLTTAVGVALAADSGPGSTTPQKNWNCSVTRECASKTPNHITCNGTDDGCCVGKGAAAAVACKANGTCTNPDELCQ